MKKLFIITGELSGDMHAANVVRHMKEAFGEELVIEGIGGENLEKEGVKLFENHANSKMGAVGLTPKILLDHLTLGARVVSYLKNEFKPDLVLLIDYGGFNLSISKLLKRSGLKIFYFIPPQIWASRKWRLRTVKKYIDKVLTIFPFEGEMYSKAKINWEYVGHPLVSELPAPADKDAFFEKYGLDKKKKLVSIFPGSREFELKYLLKLFLDAKNIIEKERDDVQFVLSQANNFPDEVFSKHLQKSGYANDLQIIKGENQALLSVSDALILASGTVALEAALYKTPMLISYKGPWLFYLIYRLVRSIDKASLPNIITKKNIIREFLQEDARADFIANEILNILGNDSYASAMKNSLHEVKELLSDKNATQNAANIILNEFIVKSS